MSFATDINAVLIGDASINSYIDGGIHYENLIDNWLAETNDDIWIVYDFNKSEQTDCLNSKNVYMTYTLNIVVIQRSTNTYIDLITDRLVDYLNGYEAGNILDIAFVRDQTSFNQQQDIYTNTMEFRSYYLES